jgi:hypothetical protein
VPAEFLSDEQVAAFGRFGGEPSLVELDRFFYLDDADRDLTAKHHGDYNRLGFAVQLGTVRFLGTFLSDPLDVPWGVVDYLATQIGVDDPSVVKRYAQRLPTMREHAREIRTVYGYRDLTGEAADDLSAFIHSRAWTHGEGPTVLFAQATTWLRRERVLLPGVTTLTKLVQSAREEAQTDLYEKIAMAATTVDRDLPRVLRGLLEVESDGRVSRLESLRVGPTKVAGPELGKALHRAAAVRMLGVGAVDLSVVPPARVRSLARYGNGAKAQALRRLAEPRRTATLVATVSALGATAVDDALDLFDLLMASRIVGPSRRAAAKERLAAMPDLEKASSLLARLAGAMLHLLDGDVVDIKHVRAELMQVATRDEIADVVTRIGELVPDESGAERVMREQMTHRYRTGRAGSAAAGHRDPLGSHGGRTTGVGRVDGARRPAASSKDPPRGDQRNARPAGVADRGVRSRR